MKTATEFLWGTPAEVAARVRPGVPSFRLVNPAGDLPPTNRLFALPTGSTAAKMAAPHAGGSQLAATATPKALVRAGRTVGLVWEDAHAVYCSLAGVLPPDLAAPRGAQAAAIFPEMESLLAEAGMTFANVVRTWLYIDRVCEWYGEFNAARSAFFESRNVFNTFLPASTGIGSANLDGAAITAGAIAVKPKDASVHAEIVESPLQAPAMAYRSSFSRAAEIFWPDSCILFVSGTASIEPNSHEVAFVGDIEKQVACTMKAVYAILESRGYGWADVSRAIVYLKEPSFRAAWQAWLAARGLPGDFAAETVCDVCRDEWLFEIELDAVRCLNENEHRNTPNP